MKSPRYKFPIVRPSLPDHDTQRDGLPIRFTQTGRIGYGSSIAHHGEILQGVFRGMDGGLHRALVTLPYEGLRSEACFSLRSDVGLRVHPAWKLKALEAMRWTLDHLAEKVVGADLALQTRIPTCWGLGSSTSDVIATIRSVACAFERKLTPEVEAALSVRSEIASDSIMFDARTVLFAQREGYVLEDLGGYLPPLEVLGFNADPMGTGVNTLLLSPFDYCERDVEEFERLRDLLRKAIALQDPDLVGQVASASARINQSHLPKLHFDRFEELAGIVGASGLQVAHSGSVVGLLFNPSRSGSQEQIETARAKLRAAGFLSTWSFRTRAAEPEEV
jgi:uncharacterized protein involved in propanediol utilization